MSRQISYLPYRRPFREPFQTAYGLWSVREGYIVRIEENGRVGYGEIAPISDFGSESQADAGRFLEELIQEPDMLVPECLPCCAFGVSAASAMLSGIPRSGCTFDVAGLLPAGGRALAVLREKLNQGFRTFKWKIGVESLETELELFEALVRLLPAGIQLRLDANASLGEADLLKWLEAVGEFSAQVEYIEQPLAVGQEARMAELMTASGVSIALDESLNGSRGFEWLTTWPGPLVVKPALMGDICSLGARLLPVADRVVISSVFETVIGLENTLMMAAQMGLNQRAIGFDTQSVFADTLGLPATFSPLVFEPAQCVQLDQLWQTLLHSN